MPSEYIIIGKETCKFCIRAKELLDSLNFEYTYRNVNEINSADVSALQEIANKEFMTVPQIFKYKPGGGLDYIGGCTDLEKFLGN